MARKTKEIQLQQEIETQEEWEDMLSKEGLCVVDIYQEWCGPVGAMIGTFRRIKNEIGDDLLKFAVAKADTIDALEKYRGRCEPCFLFYAGGVLVAIVRGANAPLILRTITEQLAHEHKVLEGQAERKEIKDTLIAELEQKEREMEEEEEEAEEPVKEVSVAIIKPDAVQSGKAEEIIEELKNRGIEILRQEERHLTEDEVKHIYSHLQDESFFEDLVTFMTSSPCIVLAITKGKTGENIIKEFRDMIGPKEVEQAKEEAPDSLRAKYGSEKFMNAVHGSDSKDMAARELAFFFPDFTAPKVEGKPKIQRTLALIRPDVYKEHKDEIMSKIRESGFKVAIHKELHLTKEQAEDFYREHQGQEYFEELTTRMSSGPMLALCLAREDAISAWRSMLGPKKVDEAKEQQPDSLRAQFTVEGAHINMFHGSDSEETARKELEMFFPMEQTVAVIKPDAYGTKDEIIDKIHEAGFRIAARKETTLTKEMAEEFYKEHKDKEYFGDLVEHMTSGPTYFMVLSREGAVEGWRSMIGPTDPAQAKETDAEADKPLRGVYGTDTLRNALHGSSNPEHAKTTITNIFGELTFNKDGSLTKEEEEEPPKEEKKEEQTEEKKEKEAEQAPQEEQAPQQEEQAEVKEEKPPSPAPQAQEEQKPEETTQEEPPKEEQKPAEEPQAEQTEQQVEATEEPQKEEEPPKTEEPAKTEEPPKTEEPVKTEEEAPKAEEEAPKTEESAPERKEEETPKTDEAKPDETASGEKKTEESQPAETQAKEGGDGE